MTFSNSNSTLSLASKVHIESIQTVVPIKPTDPFNSCRISISPQNHLDSSILRRRFHLILCYKKASDEDSGWLMAGWIKESLGIALCELSMLAGRLRVEEESEDGDRELQIVLNDSGVRLVEARVEMKLAEFFDLEEKREAQGDQAVFWEDVLEHNQLQFSPLFWEDVLEHNQHKYDFKSF